MTTSILELESQIERLVEQHIAACRQAATAAVERAFASVGARQPKANRAGGSRAPAKRRAAGPRREQAEVAGLAERLYAAVCANPGETMSELMARADIGGSARKLHRPMGHLKPGRRR